MAGPSRFYVWWKSLRMPWRRQRLAGSDLAGNTFWEFKDALNANRFRRIVKYSRRAAYADVKISPQWHQWLRHTRLTAPTIQEQQADELRQANMKQLAARADERWNSVPSFLDAPDKRQPGPALKLKDPGGHVHQQTEPTSKQGVRAAVGTQQEVRQSSSGQPGRERHAAGATTQQQSAPWAPTPKSEGDPKSWRPDAANRR